MREPVKFNAFGQQVIARELFIDILLVRIRFIIEMVWWIGLAPWEYEFPFPGCLIPTFLEYQSGCASPSSSTPSVSRSNLLQGNLAHKKQSPPPRTTIGPYA